MGKKWTQPTRVGFKKLKQVLVEAQEQSLCVVEIFKSSSGQQIPAGFTANEPTTMLVRPSANPGPVPGGHPLALQFSDLLDLFARREQDLEAPLELETATAVIGVPCRHRGRGCQKILNSNAQEVEHCTRCKYKPPDLPPGSPQPQTKPPEPALSAAQLMRRAGWCVLAGVSVALGVLGSIFVLAHIKWPLSIGIGIFVAGLAFFRPQSLAQPVAQFLAARTTTAGSSSTRVTSIPTVPEDCTCSVCTCQRSELVTCVSCSEDKPLLTSFSARQVAEWNGLLANEHNTPRSCHMICNDCAGPPPASRLIKGIKPEHSKCDYCHKTAFMTVEHMHPKTWRPELKSEKTNFSFICQPCNISRGNMGMLQWLQTQPEEYRAKVESYFTRRGLQLQDYSNYPGDVEHCLTRDTAW